MNSKKRERLSDLGEKILNKEKYKDNLTYSLKIHLDYINKIKKKNTFSEENIHDLIQIGIGEVFSKVLEHYCVFKWVNDGRVAYR